MPGKDSGGDALLEVSDRSFSVALNADYLNNWNAGISYTDYLAHPGYSWGDRDFIALSLSVSF